MGELNVMIQKIWDELDSKVESGIEIISKGYFSLEFKLYEINKIHLTDKQKAYLEELNEAEKEGMYEEKFPDIYAKYFLDEPYVYNLEVVGRVYCYNKKESVNLSLHINGNKKKYTIKNEQDFVNFKSDLDSVMNSLKA